MNEKEEKDEEMTLEEMLKSVPEDYAELIKDEGFTMEEVEELIMSNTDDLAKNLKNGEAFSSIKFLKDLEEDSWMDNQPKRSSVWDCDHKNTEEKSGDIVCKECGLTLDEKE